MARYIPLSMISNGDIYPPASDLQWLDISHCLGSPMARYITLPRISFCQLAEIHKTNNPMSEQLFASAGNYFSLFYCLNVCTLHIYKERSPMHSRDENYIVPPPPS